MDDQYLQHHGVKGMRWGVRRVNSWGRKAAPLARKNEKLHSKGNAEIKKYNSLGEKSKEYAEKGQHLNANSAKIQQAQVVKKLDKIDKKLVNLNKKKAKIDAELLKDFDTIKKTLANKSSNETSRDAFELEKAYDNATYGKYTSTAKIEQTLFEEIFGRY